MRKKMTSKEALWDLKCNAIEQCDWENDRLDIIEKDLEILEMLKNKMSIEIAYYNGDKRYGTYKYIAYNGTPLDIETKEEFNKIKEWLLK